jgi:hypothetical protein
LNSRDYLNLVTVAKPCDGPRTAGHDIAVDGDGDAGGRRGQLGDRLCHRAAVGQVAGLAIEPHQDTHGDPPPPQNRKGVNGCHSGAGAWPVSKATAASAVTGDIKMPLR